MANIQTIEGFRNFDSILQVANGVMVTRQELGSDITPKKLVIAQKNMIARANRVSSLSVSINQSDSFFGLIRLRPQVRLA